MIAAGEADFLVVLAPSEVEVTRPLLRQGRASSSRPTLVDEKALPNRRSLNVALLGRALAPPRARRTRSGSRRSGRRSRSAARGERAGVPSSAATPARSGVVVRREDTHEDASGTTAPAASTRRARRTSCRAGELERAPARAAAGGRARAPTSACRSSAAAWRSGGSGRTPSARSPTSARLPFTVKTDLRDTYPFGLFASPMEEIVRLHASSGTTGKPIVVAYTAGRPRRSGRA